MPKRPWKPLPYLSQRMAIQIKTLENHGQPYPEGIWHLKESNTSSGNKMKTCSDTELNWHFLI